MDAAVASGDVPTPLFICDHCGAQACSPQLTFEEQVAKMRAVLPRVGSQEEQFDFLVRALAAVVLTPEPEEAEPEEEVSR
jgi:hypothetical protein